MKQPSPRRLWFYVTRRLGLRSYFEAPGDGRKYPQIPAKTLLWALLLGQLLRECTFHGVESLVRISGCRALLVSKTRNRLKTAGKRRNVKMDRAWAGLRARP
jgi:hypothetical protein